MTKQLKEWATLVNDYFQAGLDETSARRWGREIALDCPNASPQDVIDAIRNRKNEDFRFRKVNVGDVIRWVREVAPQSAKDLRSCSLCHRGMIDFKPDLQGDGFTLDDYSRAYGLTIPCMCASGRYRSYQQNFSDHGKMRHRATMQRQHQNKLIEEFAAELPEQEAVAE